MIIVRVQTLTSPVQSMKPTLKSLLRTGWQVLIIDYFLLNIDSSMGGSRILFILRLLRSALADFQRFPFGFAPWAQAQGDRD